MSPSAAKPDSCKPCMRLFTFNRHSTLRHEPVLDLALVEVTDDPACERATGHTAVHVWHDPVPVERDAAISPWSISLPTWRHQTRQLCCGLYLRGWCTSTPAISCQYLNSHRATATDLYRISRKSLLAGCVQAIFDYLLVQLAVPSSGALLKVWESSG